MKKILQTLAFCLALIAVIPVLAFTHYFRENQKNVDEVKNLIETAYFNGAFNELDTKSMAKGFHPEFAIFSTDGEKLKKYPIKEWINNIEARKARADFDLQDSMAWEGKFAQVDVTGESAMAKVELSKNGNHVFTDYLSLLKFNDGWKIVGKVYHKHPQK